MIMFGSGTWLQCNKNILNLQHLMFLKAKVVLAFITSLYLCAMVPDTAEAGLFT